MTEPNITCFLSSKGGSGKTVTSSALGTFLSAQGFKVLLVDTDAATNGLTLLFLEQLLGWKRRRPKETIGMVGLFDLSDDSLPDILNIDDKLDFIPATYSMSDSENVDFKQYELGLSAIVRVRDRYDFIFLDAQAGTDRFARCAAAVADQCIVVSEYDPVSVQGIDRLKLTFGTILDPARTWILFNKILPEFASLIGEGLEIARYLPPIPWDADVVRAFARRDLAIDTISPNPYTLAIAQLSIALFPDEIFDHVTEWRGRILDESTSPIKQKLEEVEEEIKITRLKAKRQDRLELLRYFATTVFAVMTAGMTLVVTTFQMTPSVVSNLIDKVVTTFVYDPLAILLPVTAVITVVAMTPLVVRMISSRDRHGAALNLQVLRREREKLTTAFVAAEASMRLSTDGIYSRRRRKRRGQDEIGPKQLSDGPQTSRAE